MSYYVFGSKMSYNDYLTGKSFVGDLTSATSRSGRAVSMDILRRTRELIVSNEALSRDNIRVIETSADRITGTLGQGLNMVTGALNDGFERLTYGMEEISTGISELNATFHWGFAEVIAVLGHMNDALSELVKIAKTPVQTVAFNHFEIARDAYRQGLYQECIEELDKAISGDHTLAGYKLEWRFHQMKGAIQLGFNGGDLSLVDLAGAEQSFLLAARYARTDYPEDAARASLSAGWAAYCQGKMPEALAHTEQSIGLNPRMGEAFFQAAKVRMAMNDVDKALPVLVKAIEIDSFYVLKAAGDGDFQPHDNQLCGFLEALIKEKYRQSVPIVKATLEKIAFWRKHSPGVKNIEAVVRLDSFLKKSEDRPIVDMLEVLHGVEKAIGKIETDAKDAIVILPVKVPIRFREVEEIYQEKENYQEKVVVKPGGLFRRAVKETVTKTRVVKKTRTVRKAVEGIKDDIFTGVGEKITSIEFCPIPAGTFMMGDGNERHQVTLTRDFLFGKYLVTQAQWEAVMGENPSDNKGADQPVERVSWKDCQKFIDSLNGSEGRKIYRLPTEAEWEYACRAGSGTAYCFGDDGGQLGDYAWHEANSGQQTHPVGQKKPNDWGLYDMHGNVWEWCQDWHEAFPAGPDPATDPKGASHSHYRVRRGGDCRYDPSYCRSAKRFTDSPESRYGINGFRLLRTAD